MTPSQRELAIRSAVAGEAIKRLSADESFQRRYSKGDMKAIDAFNNLVQIRADWAGEKHQMVHGQQIAADQVALDKINAEINAMIGNGNSAEAIRNGDHVMVRRFNEATAQREAIMTAGQPRIDPAAREAAVERMAVLTGNQDFMRRYDARDPEARAQWAEVNGAFESAITGEAPASGGEAA